jgi:hypothetical protein
VGYFPSWRLGRRDLSVRDRPQLLKYLYNAQNPNRGRSLGASGKRGQPGAGTGCLRLIHRNLPAVSARSSPRLSRLQLSFVNRTTPLRSSRINICSDTFLQPPFGSLSRISGGCRSSKSSNVNLSSTANSPNSGSVMINFAPFFPWLILASDTRSPLTRRATFLADSILQQLYWPALPNQVTPVQKQA